MVLCTCNECRFMYPGSLRMSCPDCGAKDTRIASREEKEEYLRYQREFYPQGRTA